MFYKLLLKAANESGGRMVYITGDTHGEYGRFSSRRMRAQGMELTEKDYVIVCGDFGLCWTKNATFHYECDFFEGKPFTVLWVQGNHENYDFISEFKIEEWNGGKVRHIVRDKVILLERGQVFTIQGKTFFTFGGAASHDIQGGVLDRKNPDYERLVKKAKKEKLPYRILRETWWPEELPSEEEMSEGIRNLEKVKYKVDYVISHCCSTRIQNLLDSEPYKLFEADILTEYFENLEDKLEYTDWYFGHYHMDRRIDEKHMLLYKTIIKTEQKEPDVSKVSYVGQPKYKWRDCVRFEIGDKRLEGVIEIVDAWGTFEQNEEPSYDILCKEENCLYKHILESEIIERTEQGEC